MGVGSVGGGNQPVDQPQQSNGINPTGGATDQGQGTDASQGATGSQASGDAAALGGSQSFGDLATTTDLMSGTASALEARAVCNEIALTAGTTDAAARSDMFSTSTDNTRTNQQERANQQGIQDAFVARTEAHADVQSANLGEAFQRGDTAALKASFLSILSGGNSIAAKSGNQATLSQGQGQPGALQPGQGMFGKPAVPLRGDGTGAGTGTEASPQPQQPIFPGAAGRLATLTPEQLAAFARGNPSQPGQPKTPLQQAFDRLQRACAEGNHEEAAKILSQHPELGEALERSEETRDSDEVAKTEEGEEAEGTGEGGRAGRSDGDTGGQKTRIARTFSPDEHLQQGIMEFSGRGGREGEVDSHSARMRAGLRLVCGGGGASYATRTELGNAVHGTYAQEQGRDGTGSGGGSRDSSVEFGTLTDTDGTLRGGGYRLDTAAAGLGGSYGVRTPDGKFIPQWLAASDRGGLPPGVRAAIARDAGLRTRFGAEAISGARAGMTGDLWAGQRC